MSDALRDNCGLGARSHLDTYSTREAEVYVKCKKAAGVHPYRASLSVPGIRRNGIEYVMRQLYTERQ